MEEYPIPVTKQGHIKILEQMNNSIFEIIKNEKVIDIGLFFYIKLENKNVHFILINNYINNENYRELKRNIIKKYESVELDNIIYRDKYYNISVIKIKEIKKSNIIKYIEIDDEIYKKKCEKFYIKESIYIIQYNNIKDTLISYGLIKRINHGKIIYNGKINSNYKFCPIFNLYNNKLIGIQNNSSIFSEIILVKSIINEIMKENKHRYFMNKKNEIEILININKEDINKKTFFLDNYEFKDKKGIIHYHDNLKELNSQNTELLINNKKYIYRKYFRFKKEGKNIIILKFNVNLINSSYMFAGCEKIIDINFINFNTSDIINAEYMFYKCKNLKKLNLFLFDTEHINNMSYMFYECSSLNNIDLSSFNTKNVKDMTGMFRDCSSLKNLPDISKFDTRNVTNISWIFSGCSSLTYLPDLSKLCSKHINNLSNMFSGCRALKNLTDISE